MVKHIKTCIYLYKQSFIILIHVFTNMSMYIHSTNMYMHVYTNSRRVDTISVLVIYVHLIVLGQVSWAV